MIVVGQIRKGAYFDSITLMRCGKEITALPGISDAAVVMGTKSNKAILDSSGLLTSEFTGAGDTDLLIAIKAASEKTAEMGLAAVDGLLKRAVQKTGSSSESHAVSLERALELLPGANLALISVAGRYAADEAMRALEHGLHVMIFSDNVPLEEEVKLKKYALKKGLLVMGPDCGTAIVNGVPLAFANVVNRGDIGIVAAAGTGLQEVSCIVSTAGAGVSQAIGTGGREVKKEVGGIMFVEAIKALARDPNTRVILLISKPPDKEVLATINRAIKGIRKPVITLLIGARTEDGGPSTLEEAALTAVAASRGENTDSLKKQLQARDEKILKTARGEAVKRVKNQKYVRGLFSGGTFCAEAQVLFSDMISDVYSNAPAGASKPLKNALKSQKNSVIDLGEDEFTVGRPHPMIDYSLRNRRILQEAADPETAVILLDVVLGHGSHPDPAAELSPIIREVSKKVAVVCSVTGTDQDPQNRSEVEKRLKKAGAIIMPTNAAACKLAGSIIQYRGKK
ncbi:MAG: acyl-CoA synthetase FdrA [Acidobacteriia bacterium]|nr:acyl-CoA synthetase FdrA [Terriglobia bacterium]